MTSFESKITDDHDFIKKWTEERYGEPAVVEGVVDKEKAGEMLRIHFIDDTWERLKGISWELFFDIFEKNNLALLYHVESSGGHQSKYYKLIDKTSGVALEMKRK